MSTPVEEALRGLTMKELRSSCRARNINPAGNVEALKQRLGDDMRATGDLNIASGEVAAPEPEDDSYSKNNYQRPGGAQNVGNRITDRPTSRVLAPPGGVSQISFGDSEPAPRRPAAGALPAAPPTPAAGEVIVVAEQKGLFSGLGSTCKQEKDAVPPVGGYKGLSQVSFGEYQLPSYQAQNPTAAPYEKTTAERAQDALTIDVDKLVKSLMIKDLRNCCRARNLSPAGGVEQLRERLAEHMVVSGDTSVVVGGTEPGLPSGAGPQPAPPAMAFSGAQQQGDQPANNNYHRPAGQNVGNYMTGRNSSRVSAPPGGHATIILG